MRIIYYIKQEKNEIQCGNCEALHGFGKRDMNHGPDQIDREEKSETECRIRIRIRIRIVLFGLITDPGDLR